MQSHPRARSSSQRTVNLRHWPTPAVDILACPIYDFLLSIHVCLSSPEYDYAAYDVGRPWVEAARTRCGEDDPSALDVLGRYLGANRPDSLHGTLLSLVWEMPEPRTVPAFLVWLAELPPADLAEVLLDQSGLGADWRTLLALTLGIPAVGDRAQGGVASDVASGMDVDMADIDADVERAHARASLIERYPEAMRETVATVLDDAAGIRAALCAALATWERAVFAAEEPRISPLLVAEAAALARRREEVPLAAFIEEAMRGVLWQRPSDLRRIVFAPSAFCGPAVFYHFWRGTLTFCAPVRLTDHERTTRARDPYAPDEETQRFFVALGDPTRLRILSLLAEREMYLTELAEHIGLTKATTKYHMVRLRDAGLVTLYDRERLTYYALRPAIAQRAAGLLRSFLEEHPAASSSSAEFTDRTGEEQRIQ